MKNIRKIVNSFLDQKVSIVSWSTAFFGIIMTRLFLDKFIAKNNFSLFDLIMDVHNAFFFLLTFLLVWLVLSLVFREKPLKLAQLMIWASLFIVFPPIFDLAKTHGDVFWSFYLISSPQDLLKQMASFWGHLPSGIVYFGTKITFVVGIFSLGLLAFIKTGKIVKGILAAVFSYLALFFMSAFPSLLAYLGIYIQKGRFLDIKPFEIIQWFSKSQAFGVKLNNFAYSLPFCLNLIYFLLILGVLLIFFYFSEKQKFLAVIKNFRYPQVIYHSGLFILGVLLGILAFPGNFNWNLLDGLSFLVLLVAVWISWKASVVTNDIYDFKIDEITNSKRPLPRGLFSIKEYSNLGILAFLLAILAGFSIHYKIGWLLAFYQILAWFYSAPPFRFKRFPFISTLVSSLASLVILMAGYILVSPNQDLTGFSWRIFFLLLITYTLCLPIKDFKDIEGDKKYGVKTIPVIFGEANAGIIIGISFFVSYILSVFFLNEWRLFWWSLIFGSLSFWTLNNKKIAYSRLVWLNLGLVFVYGLILVKTVFF